MADLAVWQRTIVDPAGNTVPNAEVEVRHSDSSALADIYLDREGAQAAPNPITADGNGFVRFYAPGGAYRVEAYGGGATAVWDFVAVGRLAEHDAIGAGQFDDDEGEHEAIRDKLDLASGTEVKVVAEAADTAVDLASEEALLAGEFFQAASEAEVVTRSIARDEHGQPVLPFDERGQPILYLDADFYTGETGDVAGGISIDERGQPVLPFDNRGQPILYLDTDFYTGEIGGVAGGIVVGDHIVLPWGQGGQPILYLDADFYTEEADEVAGGIAVGNRIVLPWGRDGVPILPDPSPPVPEPTPVALLRRPDVAQAGDQLVCLEGVYSETPHHLDVRWYRNGVQMPGAVSRRIAIDETSAVYRCEEVATFSAARVSTLSLPWAVNTSLSPEEQAERDADTDYRTGAADASPLPPPALETGEFAAIDVASGQPLFLSNADDDIAVASTSKIATCILLDRWAGDLSEVVTITEDHIPGFIGTLAGLEAGDTITLDGLGYGLMLPSGNDAANAIADVIGGKMREADGLPTGSYEQNVDRFVQGMNDLATEIGMEGTTFHNPSGGPGGSNSNRSTALAMAYLVAEASRHPVTRKFMATRQKDVPVGGPNARTLNLVNTASSIMEDEGFVAGKTGSGGGGSSGIYASVWKVEGGSVALVVSNAGSNAARVPLTRELRDEVKATFAWINGWAQPK